MGKTHVPGGPKHLFGLTLVISDGEDGIVERHAHAEIPVQLDALFDDA